LVVTNNFFKLDTFTIVVTAHNNITNITANASPSSVCPGGQTTLTGSGGISYNWSGGISNGVAFIPSATSTYTVIGIDANGCTNTSAVTVTVHQTNPITITPTDPTLCLGDSVQLTASGANNYIWSNIPGLNIYSGATVWAFPNVNTTFTVTGTDANGCTGTSSVTISITTAIDVQITKNRDAECNINIVQLQATGAQNYSWTPANLLSNPSAALTNATVLQTTTFYLTGNTGSCVDMDSIVVNYYNNDETGIIIPNAFSPNGDGINDCLKVLQNANFTEYYFTIYNRWGERVFETDDPLACWNGEHKNKPAEMETYGYFLRAETVCGKIFKKGDITLVK
jgi:gliding motility-associated-like protein